MDPKFANMVLPWIGRIERLFSIAMSDGLSKVGLTYAEFRLVGLLWGEEGGVSQRDLAASLGQDASGISVLLKRLEEKGVVERGRDKKDARVIKVKCTPKVYEETHVVEHCEKIEEEATRGMSDEEKAQLVVLLQKVANNLN